ncbi:FliA/WhiG family RNA polymerase sigma factor [Vibrio sp. Y2-5]|uniref:FliA/WhiG family RNA polymerase sigma factor n=1 Tax=Vibrio TaxID=662 RepID=UPI00142D754F|nr:MULTISPECIES: FliA/WhiG family RNA polymerase sigma factor [Vibrio]MBD0786799.1 FliA/WhiG family RNA polymerase sigma factor [Vibrio sp. Y2-5]NIY93247.1 FliA/WhiG family RNA polymerase sigma factor [Vibrio diazotrophicus]
MLDMQYQDAYSHSEDINSPAVAIDENYLLSHFQHLVKRVSNQLRVHANTHCSIEDMQQVGLIGLLEAGRRYGDIDDPNFPAFAVCRIRGAILDELRRLDWRSRKTRQDAHQLNDVTRDLTRKLGRQPSESEIIQALGTNGEDYHSRLNALVAGEMQSLDQLIENGVEHFSEDGYDSISHEHTRRSLERSVEQLNKREQLLLTLFYQHELNLNEIALVLDLTPARVCQLHKQALNQLNHHLSS